MQQLFYNVFLLVIEGIILPLILYRLVQWLSNKDKNDVIN